MVNSNVIRAGGLIILAVCFVTVERVFHKNVTESAEDLTVGLVGSGRGSMYNTCASDSKTLQRLTSVDLKHKPATDLKYNFYSIDNPKEYLSGGDAVVVEQGPYLLRKHSVAYDVSQKPSSLSAASEPNGALEYSTANAYLVLDQDVTATSTLQRGNDLSIAFSGNKETLPTTERKLANHLSMSDSVTNLAPDYLSLLGAMNDEVNMILSLHCTSEQIANIGIPGRSQCTANELGDTAAIHCSCCMRDDDYALAASRSIGSPPSDTNCNSYFDDEGPTMSRLSLLASYDGGVAVKAAGETKYDGSGNTFTATSFGQTEIHTPLIQRHTINDLMFGYPSAYLGTVAFFAQREQAKKSLSTQPSNTELAERMLTGEMDNVLSFKLGNIAQYTSKVGDVCYASCLQAGGCSGSQAPGRHEIHTDVDRIKLGGIDCKPYTPTFETKAKCEAIQENLNAPGFEACVCANGSDEWGSKGCCLAAGKHDGNDLRGEGCLFEVAGMVDPNYAGMDSDIPNAIDLGLAVQSWIDKEVSKPSSEFMCPAAGKEIDEHVRFGYYETFEGRKNHTTYFYTANDRMRQDDVDNSASTPYTAPVTGGSGKFFIPKGLTMKVGTSEISDGYPMNIPNPVYVPSAKRTVNFVYEGVRDKYVRNKICGSDTCIVSARLRPHATSFSMNEEIDDGTGLPFDGLQTVGHIMGPSSTGRPEYLHQPLYFDGDELLYTQQDSSFADRTDGNGIKIYRPKTGADPGTFDLNAPESNYQLVDKTYVDSEREVLQSHIDIEVGSGLGARQRMRFGTSYSIWECDPSTNVKCKMPVNSKGGDYCYATTGSAEFDAKTAGDKEDLATLGRSNFSYPCSAANLMTPSVVGGKILPMYWYEESTHHATTEEIDMLVAHADSWRRSGETFIVTFSLAFIASFLGVSMLLLCLCFEPRHAFLKTEGLPATTT